MQVAEKKVVSMQYTLTNDAGEVLDQSQSGEPLTYLHGAGNIIPGLEKELTDKQVGDKFTVKVSPEDGYGERDNDRVEDVPREMFPEDQEIEPGMMFHAQGPNGETITVTVVDVNEQTVKIDSNHALAGVELNFDVEVIGIREAEEVELEHGHVHGPEGHAH